MMAGKYYLHRISHEGNISYNLLEQDYLTLGWSKFTDSDILKAAREEGYPEFNPIAKKYGEEHNRSRWSMWYFARMNVGDKVVVVKGRKIAHGTIGTVKAIYPYYDCYHRWIADYAYFAEGGKTNVKNCVLA